MHFTMKSLFAIAIFGIATCQYQYPNYNYNKFRPSPVDSTTNNAYNPSNDYLYNLKAPNYPPSSFQDFGNYYPSRPTYNTYPYPAPIYPQSPLTPPTQTKPLFTPAQVPYPAESAGQLANFNKFLQQEAADAQKSQTEAQFFTTGLFNSEDFGKSYVDVKFGGPQNLQYHYNI